MTSTTDPKRALSREERDSFDPDRSKHLLATIAANIENGKLSDESFRAFIRDSLPVAFKDKSKGADTDSFENGGYR